MITRNTLASILLGCSALLLTSHDVAAATRLPQVIIFPAALGPGNYSFVITDSKNKVLCQKTGVQFKVSTPPIPCANLLNVKTTETLQIVMGPESSIKCAPQGNPIKFEYQPGLDIMIAPKNIKECKVYSK